MISLDSIASDGGTDFGSWSASVASMTTNPQSQHQNTTADTATPEASQNEQSTSKRNSGGKGWLFGLFGGGGDKPNKAKSMVLPEEEEEVVYNAQLGIYHKKGEVPVVEDHTPPPPPTSAPGFPAVVNQPTDAPTTANQFTRSSRGTRSSRYASAW